MRVKILTVITSALSITLYAPYSLGAPTQEQPTDARVVSVVKKKLKDPQSARFGALHRRTTPNVRGEPTDVICGTVNAKNGYGGYTGKTGFVYLVDGESVSLADGSGPLGKLGSKIYSRFCQ